jgi:hypothetical protein
MDTKIVAITSETCCRLCLLDDGIKLPIFEGEGLQRQVAHKIETCFPILVIFIYGLVNVYYLPLVKKRYSAAVKWRLRVNHTVSLLYQEMVKRRKL